MDKFIFSIMKGLSIFIERMSSNMVSVMAIATLLFFYLAVFSVNYSATKAIDKLTDVKTLRIFLEEGTDKEKILQELSKLQMPASFKFFDKKTAKERVLKLVPGAENIKKLPEELFPDFIEMTIAEYAAVESLIAETADQVEKIGGVKTVEYGKRVGENLYKIKKTSFTFMVFISVITGIAAAVIIFNTVRLSLYRFQKKIMIYTLVGATKMFITLPYLFSAFLEASIAYLTASAGNFLFVKAVKEYLLKESYFMLFSPPPLVYFFFYILLTATAVISAFFCVGTFLMRQKSINDV